MPAARMDRLRGQTHMAVLGWPQECLQIEHIAMDSQYYIHLTGTTVPAAGIVAMPGCGQVAHVLMGQGI